jgi:hypothetical protein
VPLDEDSSSAETEKVYIAPLARLAAWIFSVWGILIILKAFYDLFLGEPEANLYSARPWQFVSLPQWMRYSGFELSYGAACLALAAGIRAYSKLLPKTLNRPKKPALLDLFK